LYLDILPIPKIYSNNLQILVNRLLAKDPMSRPSIEEIYLFDFIKEKRDSIKNEENKEKENKNKKDKDQDQDQDKDKDKDKDKINEKGFKEDSNIYKIKNIDNDCSSNKSKIDGYSKEKRKVNNMCFKFSDFSNNNLNNNNNNNNIYLKPVENLSKDTKENNEYYNNNNINYSKGNYRDLSSRGKIGNFDNKNLNLIKFPNNDKEERSKSNIISKGNIKEIRNKIDLYILNKNNKKSFDNKTDLIGNFGENENHNENFGLNIIPISKNKEKGNKNLNFLPNGKSPNAKKIKFMNIRTIKKNDVYNKIENQFEYNNECNNNNNNKSGENDLFTIRKNSHNSPVKNISTSIHKFKEKEKISPSNNNNNNNFIINSTCINSINTLSLQESKIILFN
jgi:hypothetical protein